MLCAFSFKLSRAQTYVTAPLTGTPAAGSYYSNSSILLSSGFSFAAAAGQNLQLYTVPADCIPLVNNFTAGQNYIVTSSPRIGGITDAAGLANRSTCDVMQTVQYLDGLGRPLQTVQVEGSATDKDVVQPYAYDVFGREAVKYLPYAITGSVASDGSYKTDALNAGAGQAAFYASPPAGVTQISTPQAAAAFEPDPLDRVVEQGAPGDDWQLGHHTVKTMYANNDGTIYWAKLYTVTIDGSGNRALVYNGSYANNQLNVTVSQNENWTTTQPDPRLNSVEEYRDKDGHMVLKRTYNYTTELQTLSTYYIYDDLGNLAFVLPPGAGPDGSAAPAQSVLDNFAYQYRYDERNRLTQKKVPGKGWEYTVYNILDQPVATQDSLQRAANQWIFTKFDAQGRAVQTGIWTGAVSRASLQSTVNSQTSLWEAPQNSGNGYTNVAWPASGVTATLTLNYYDGYDLIPGLPGGYAAPAGSSTTTRGLLTASLTGVLGSSDMLWTVHYYDDLGRVTATYAQHYLGGTLNAGNYDKVTHTYDFTNEIITSTRQHYTAAAGSLPAVTVANTFAYDHEGRKTQTWQQINGGANILMSQTHYNEVGQVLNKQLHSENTGASFLQNIAYTYNERGWLTQSSAPLFAMQLKYNDGAVPQYNGNIANQYWGTRGALANSYAYTYDALNRLTSGIASTGNTEKSIVYDNMGNITALNRYQAGTQIDSLAYTYSGTNQLQSITDASGSNTGVKAGTGLTYAYDGNGNVTTDPSRNSGSINIAYNLLNLPQSITGAKTITYTYDAAGNKLRRVSTGTGNTDYISGIEYDGTSTDTLNFIQTEEGRAVKYGSTYDYQYYLGDNLGNTRVTFGTKTGAAVLLQQDDYYPFGMEINRSVGISKNEYLYNKKELQEELGQYDYGARFYDPVIGRWNTIDPLAEVSRRWSPYNYVEDDPIRLTDPDGMCPECEVKVKNPTAGQTYVSTGGATYVYEKDGGWTRQGGELAEVKIHPEGYAQGPQAEAGNGSASAGLFRAGFNEDGDYAGASGNVSGFEGEAHAKAGDGKVEAGASADVVKADVSVRLGTKDVNANGNANGSLLSANAGISGEANLSKNGKTDIGAKAEAGAYVAKGEYTGGINILGVKIEFTQGGSIGSAHIGASGNAGVDLKNKTVGAEGSFNIGLGVGVKEGIKIQFHW